MNKHLLTALKMVLVAALFWWVFSNVQWHDQYVETDDKGAVVEQWTGSLEGRWDEPVVNIRRDGESEAQQKPLGDLGNGREASVSPGLITYFLHLDKLWFTLGALAYLCAMVIASQRWWWLLHVNGLDVGRFETLRFTWIGVFFNNVVPGQTGGDVVKALYIVKRCPGGRMEALMSVIVDRILGLGSLALLGAIVVLFQLDRFGMIAAAIWGVVALVLLMGVFAFSRRVRSATRLDTLLRKLPEKLSAPLMRVDQAVHFYHAHKFGILVWLGIGVLNHVISVGSFVLMGLALGVGMPIDEYFVLIPVILIVSAVPIAPNGWGVGEALFGTLFGKFGAVHLPAGVPNAAQVMATRGVALSVLYRLTLTFWSLVGGLLMLGGRDKVSREEFQAEVAREAEEQRELVSGGGD